MNAFNELLNSWGERLLAFAWPMLWQSSVLILVVAGIDLLLRNRLSAAWRYALWLVVLLKLLLPPSLALPTGIAWWIPSPKPPTAIQPRVRASAGPVVMTPAILAPAVSATEPPAISTPLTVAGASLLAAAVGILGLLACFGSRQRRVSRWLEQAVPATPELSALAEGIRQECGVRRRIPVLLTNQSISPAVCGLVRPVILLPAHLPRQLSTDQLRAVLWHEMLHLRRGDVWINCVQTFLQIAYWWHPLLWAANARLRRVREEAVDEAVLYHLKEHRESYAEALLQVARLALIRPVAALGLVGIMESRSFLKQRIERLLVTPPPRPTGLTLVSLLGLLTFTAMAVPMQPAPPRSNPPVGRYALSTTPVAAIDSTPVKKTAPASEIDYHFHRARLLIEAGDATQARVQLLKVLALSPGHRAAEFYLAQLEGRVPSVNSPTTNRVIADQAATNATSTNFVSRRFNLGLADLVRILERRTATSSPGFTHSINDSIKAVFQRHGVHLLPTESVFYDSTQGRLYIKATPANAEDITRLLTASLSASRQVRITAYAVDLPASSPAFPWYVNLLKNSYSPQLEATDANPVLGPHEVLSFSQFAFFQKVFREREGEEPRLAETLTVTNGQKPHFEFLQGEDTNAAFPLALELSPWAPSEQLILMKWSATDTDSKKNLPVATISTVMDDGETIFVPYYQGTRRMLLFLNARLVDSKGNFFNTDNQLRKRSPAHR